MRVVSLLPAGTDIVAALGAGDQLVGRTHECDWPPELVRDLPVVTVSDVTPGTSSRELTLDHTGSAVFHLDARALAALEPDLVLTQDICDVCAVSYQAVNEAVRVLDLDTTVLSLEARTVAGILDSIDTVAERLGVTDAAGRLRAGLLARLDALPGGPAWRADALVADADRLPGTCLPVADGTGPTVLFVEWLDPFMPGGHWVPEQILLAGGQPVLLGPGEHSVTHLWPAVLECAPDVVVLGPCGLSPDQTLAELGAVTKLPGWSDLPAVRDGQVWVVDGPAFFNRPGPRVVDGAEILADVLAGTAGPEQAIRVSS
ncbi:ABC transporter substrate-binding protein [Luedemannella helvata]|uniref:Cobalamin-binding protein n=1 Tax=Luedemannella helvata TaxID=349315 RepID=A0ABN2L2P0_9ACTN